MTDERKLLTFIHKKYNKVSVLCQKAKWNYHQRGKDLIEAAVHANFVGGRFTLDPGNPYYNEIKAELLKHRKIVMVGDTPKPTLPAENLNLERDGEDKDPVIATGVGKSKLLLTHPGGEPKVKKVK